MQGEAKVGRGFPYSSVLRERCARTEPASSSGCIAGCVFLYLALLCSAPAVVLSETGRPGRVKAIPARIHKEKEKSERPRRPPYQTHQTWRRSGVGARVRTKAVGSDGWGGVGAHH
mgnify:CR=1 FL=1